MALSEERKDGRWGWRGGPEAEEPFHFRDWDRLKTPLVPKVSFTGEKWTILKVPAAQSDYWMLAETAVCRSSFVASSRKCFLLSLPVCRRRHGAGRRAPRHFLPEVSA